MALALLFPKTSRLPSDEPPPVAEENEPQTPVETAPAKSEKKISENKPGKNEVTPTLPKIVKPMPNAPLPAPKPSITPIPTPTPTPQLPELSDNEIYSRFSKSVIQIFCRGRQELFSASGVIINRQGLVMTNAHVAEIMRKVGEENCQARHGNPADPFAKLKVIFTADTAKKINDTQVPQRDIAFLKIFDATADFSVAEVVLTEAQNGENLLTLGYPSEFLAGINTEINSNLVFSILRVGGFTDMDNDNTTAEGYVFSGGLALQQGSSGTALFNRQGEVVGLIFATTKAGATADRQGVGLTINYIDRIMRLETGEGLMEYIDGH